MAEEMPPDVRTVRAAAVLLRRLATERLSTFGADDVRGAAWWDAANYIHPEDGDALHLWRNAPDEACRANVDTNVNTGPVEQPS